MRPMDLYTEKNTRDGSPDKIACSMALLSDVQSLSLLGISKQGARHDKNNSAGHDRGQDKSKSTDGDDFHTAKGMGGRDKLALASIAFCSPLMILGLGAGFAVADNLRMNREAMLKNGGEFRPRAARFIPREEEDKPAKRAVLSMPTERASLRNQVKPETRKERLTYENRKSNILFPSEQDWRPKPSPERSWVKASKLLKRKLALQDQLEKLRGQLDLNQVSAIVSLIERLDKDLKKMGC